MAVYVDHDLQEESALWSKHCDDFCRDKDIDFIGLKVVVESTSRKGVEAEARRLRYQAFLKTIDDFAKKTWLGDIYLLTGHHQRDQAETVLLNLFRGSGVNGLAGMPADRTLITDNGVLVSHVRPMLNTSYDDIVEYAHYHSLPFVTDKTNIQTEFKRNAVRHNVLPTLEANWPKAIDALSRTAQHMQEALVLLDGYAEEFLKTVDDSAYFIELQDFSEVSWVKQKNNIRYWFKLHWPQIVLSEVHYQWIEKSFTNYHKSQNHNYRYQLPEGSLRFYQNRLYYFMHEPRLFSVQIASIADLNINPSLEGEGMFFYINRIDGLLNMIVRSVLPTDNLQKKALKRFFQHNKIPKWERSVWPVLEIDGVVISVLGCIDCLPGLAGKSIEVNQANAVRVDYNQLLKWWGVFN